MKRFLALLLSLMMILSFTPNVFADSQITLGCDLTCDGENEVTKKQGDVITVTYTLKNKTDETAGYNISSHTNEIYYDPTFFEYVDGSAKVTEGLNLGTGHQVWSDPLKRSVAFAGAEFDAAPYNSNQVIGTFELKIIATEGSSTIYSARYGIASVNGNYTIDDTDLVVKIGNSVVIPKYQLTFETNGGSAVAAVKADEGTSVDLSEYKPVRKNYIFEGWYSDSDLKNEVESVLMDANKTVYAKWSKESTGGVSTSSTKYTITFETNGGSAVNTILATKNTVVNVSKYITSKAGYKFIGWYSDKDLKDNIETFRVIKNTVIYAGWKKDDSSTAVTPNPNYTPNILNAEDHFAYIVGYEDGSVHPDADITRAEVATIVFRLLKEDVRKSKLTDNNDFLDVSSDDWYNTAISTMASMNVLKGYEGYFRPNEPITRAEFAAIAARLADKDGNNSVDLKDISGHWAEAEILKAASLGWVQGFDGYYRPDDAITRAEAMTIINRVLCRIPENAADLLPEMKKWSDNSDTNKWYYINVQEATNSHDYEMKDDDTHEKWTKITENPNWAEIEN